jgi:hypothetical protein
VRFVRRFIASAGSVTQVNQQQGYKIHVVHLFDDAGKFGAARVITDQQSA